MLYLNIAWIATKYVELNELRIWKESGDSETKLNSTYLLKTALCVSAEMGRVWWPCSGRGKDCKFAVGEARNGLGCATQFLEGLIGLLFIIFPLSADG